MMILLQIIVLINLPLIIFYEEYYLLHNKIKNDAATEIHSVYKTEQILIWVQTIASICVMLLEIEPNISSIIITIKYIFFQLIYLALVGDVLSIGMIAYNLFIEKELNKFWMKAKDENSEAPESSYFLVSSVVTFYFVIKLYATWTLLRFIWNFCDAESNEAYFVNADDIKLEGNFSDGQTALPAKLPLNDQCAMESDLPPSYDVAVLKNVDCGSSIVEKNQS